MEKRPLAVLIMYLGTHVITAVAEMEVKCPLIESVPGGRVEYQNRRKNGVGGRLKVVCSVGFLRQGRSLVVCHRTGSWSAKLAVCIYTKCTYVAGIGNGTVNYMKKNILNANNGWIHIKCEKNFDLEPRKSDRLKCRKGIWGVDKFPRCIELLCPDILMFENGRVSDYSTSKNAWIKFKCDKGYDLGKGPKRQRTTRKCTGTSLSWGDLPRCTCSKAESAECAEVKCPYIVGIQGNGRVKYLNDQTNMPGGEVEFTCPDNCKIVGPRTATCQENGRWTVQELPYCKYNRCPAIESFRFGRLTDYSDSPGAVVGFECDGTFTLTGPTTATCTDALTWTELPTCRDGRCPAVPVFANGRIVEYFDMPEDKNPTIFTCDRGFLLVGPPTAHCNADLTWTQFPTCEPVECSAFNFENGQLVGYDSSTRQVELRCDDGFALNGPRLVECRPDETWSTIPSCQQTTCPPLQLENGDVVRFISGDGETAEFSCDSSFLLDGANTSQCTDGATWSPLPICISAADTSTTPEPTTTVTTTTTTTTVIPETTTEEGSGS